MLLCFTLLHFSARELIFIRRITVTRLSALHTEIFTRITYYGGYYIIGFHNS